MYVCACVCEYVCVMDRMIINALLCCDTLTPQIISIQIQVMTIYQISRYCTHRNFDRVIFLAKSPKLPLVKSELAN